MKKIFLFLLLVVLSRNVNAESTRVWQGPLEFYFTVSIGQQNYEVRGYQYYGQGRVEVNEYGVDEVIGRLEGYGTPQQVYSAFMEWPNYMEICEQTIDMYNSSPNRHNNWTLILIPVLV